MPGRGFSSRKHLATFRSAMHIWSWVTLPQTSFFSFVALSRYHYFSLFSINVQKFFPTESLNSLPLIRGEPGALNSLSSQLLTMQQSSHYGSSVFSVLPGELLALQVSSSWRDNASATKLMFLQNHFWVPQSGLVLVLYMNRAYRINLYYQEVYQIDYIVWAAQQQLPLQWREGKNCSVHGANVSVAPIYSSRPTSFMKNYRTSVDTSPLFSLGTGEC